MRSLVQVVVAAQIFLVASTSSAEVYQWVDRNGTTHFTDNAIAPPKGAVRRDLEDANVTETPPRVRHRSPAEDYSAKEPEPYYSAEVDAQLKRMWEMHLAAMRRRDVRMAVEMIHPSRREGYRAMLKALGRRVRKMVAGSIRELRLSGMTETHAEYDIISDDGFSYPVTFVKDDKWYIYSY